MVSPNSSILARICVRNGTTRTCKGRTLALNSSDLRLVLFQLGPRQIVGIEIVVVAGQQVAALTGLGVLHGRQYVLQRQQHLVCALHGLGCVVGDRRCGYCTRETIPLITKKTAINDRRSDTIRSARVWRPIRPDNRFFFMRRFQDGVWAPQGPGNCRLRHIHMRRKHPISTGLAAHKYSIRI